MLTLSYIFATLIETNGKEWINIGIIPFIVAELIWITFEITYLTLNWEKLGIEEENKPEIEITPIRKLVLD